MRARKVDKFAFCLVLALLSVRVLAEQYICVADQAAGFRFDPSARRWISASFRAETKFVISEQPKQIEKGGKFVYEGTYFLVKEMTASSPSLYFCDKSFDEYGWLFCTFPFIRGEFTFNRKSGRYLRTSPNGYTHVVPGDNRLTDEQSDTPFMEIGTCAQF